VSHRRSSGASAAWRWALAICGGVVLVDQIAKAIVVSSLPIGQHEDLLLGFSFTNTANSGLAFGIGKGQGFVLGVTIAALALVLIWFALDPSRPGLWLAVGLLAGGAIGNLADRVRADAVTDFIDPPFWPAFNLADVAITFGALGLVLVSMAPAKETHRPSAERTDDARAKPGSG
jgi:signal peptidase II